jgi:hypothetical protein
MEARRPARLARRSCPSGVTMAPQGANFSGLCRAAPLFPPLTHQGHWFSHGIPRRGLGLVQSPRRLQFARPGVADARPVLPSGLMAAWMRPPSSPWKQAVNRVGALSLRPFVPHREFLFVPDAEAFRAGQHTCGSSRLPGLTAAGSTSADHVLGADRLVSASSGHSRALGRCLLRVRSRQALARASRPATHL